MFKKRNIASLLLSVSTLSITSTIYAQDLSQDAERPPQLDKIIVTGERQVTTLKNTGSSVVVTTEAILDDFAGPDSLERIYQQTANVTPSGGDGQSHWGRN